MCNTEILCLKIKTFPCFHFIFFFFLIFVKVDLQISIIISYSFLFIVPWWFMVAFFELFLNLWEVQILWKNLWLKTSLVSRYELFWNSETDSSIYNIDHNDKDLPFYLFHAFFFYIFPQKLLWCSFRNHSFTFEITNYLFQGCF